MSKFDKAFAKTLQHEGRFSDDPNDLGGPTDFGISLRYLQGRGDLDGDGLPDGDLDGDGDVDIEDIRKLTPRAAKHLYHTGFWAPNRLDDVRSELLACKIFDMAVNMGSRQAWRIVQRACNDVDDTDALGVDGIIGPLTITRLNELERKDWDVLEEIRRNQRAVYDAIIANNSSQEKFRLGWYRRSVA